MAKFQPGHNLATGRPKDSLSKRSLRFADKIMESGVDLVAELLGALENAKHMYETATQESTKISANAQIITTAEKMLPYMYPKLSSIEVKQENQIANMSPQQRLEAMKQAVQLLEREVKQVESSTEAVQGTVNSEVAGSIPASPAKYD